MLEICNEVDVSFLAKAEGGWIGGSASCCPKSSICCNDWSIECGYSYSRWLSDTITCVKSVLQVDFELQKGTGDISSASTVDIDRSKRPISQILSAS